MAGKQKVYDEAMAMAANFRWDQDWPNAIKAYRAALAEFPEDAAAMTGVGAVYIELSQHESAIRALQRALKADPTNQEAMLKMGEALENIDRSEDAAKTYVYSGNLSARAGNLEDAVKAWEKALDVHPEQYQARHNLAQAYIRLKNNSAAIAELVTLAAIFQNGGDDAKAKAQLEQALQLDANHTYARAAMKALENGVSIRSVQQDLSQLSSIEAEISGVQPASADDDLFLIDFDEDDEQNKAASPRERTRQIAMEELAGVLFEDDDQSTERLSINRLELGTYIGQAIDMETRNRPNEAIQIYEEIIKAGFTRPSAYFVLGNLYLDSGQYDQAITNLNQARTNKQYLLGANFAIGEAYQSQENANQALRYFVEVLKIMDMQNSHREDTAKLERLYTGLIDHYIQQNNDERTLTFVDSLVKFLSSSNWERSIVEARRRLGIGQGDSVSVWIEFLESSETEIILSSMSKISDYVRGNMLMSAVEECLWAIQSAPNYLPLHMRLADVYLKQDRVEEGINKYLAVSDVYQVRENVNQVVAIYEKVLRLAPMDVTVRSKVINLQIEQGNIDAALEQYKILADAYYQLAQVNSALEKYQEALKLAPHSTRPNEWRSDILYRIGDIHNQRVDWRQAKEVYEELVRLSPGDGRALLHLADLYFKLNQSDRAIATLDRVMASYHKQNRHAEMLRVLQDMVQARPQELVLHERLAAFYNQQGMTKEALEQYDLLGGLQLDAGLRDDAARTIETVIRLGPDDPSKYKQLLAQIRGGI